ncbi:MAG TPA: hypothetical protein VG944_19825 [Fimbriimonas sp.]|nr:hypothetical protein [Fimbriimonas sp.]
MSNQDKIEEVLRKSMPGTAVPTLSPDFDRHLTSRLKPRSLSVSMRSLLIGYAAFATTASFGAMVSSGLPWWLAALATLISLMVAVVVGRYYLRLPNR